MTSHSRLTELDFETFSTAGYVWDPARRRWVSIAKSPPHGIGAVGAPAYAEHPSTEVLCAAYDFHDGTGPKLWVPGLAPPKDLFDHIETGGLIQAWNSQFEYWIWEHICHKRMGWPVLPLEQLRDGMPRAFAWGIPGALLKAGAAIGSPLQKDKDGTRLIRKFCIGRNPTIKDDRDRIYPVGWHNE